MPLLRTSLLRSVSSLFCSLNLRLNASFSFLYSWFSLLISSIFCFDSCIFSKISSLFLRDVNLAYLFVTLGIYFLQLCFVSLPLVQD